MNLKQKDRKLLQYARNSNRLVRRLYLATIDNCVPEKTKHEYALVKNHFVSKIIPLYPYIS